MMSDVLIGHNNRGPYTLSWTNVDAGSVKVIIDGRTLKQGNDYRLDRVNGTMSFIAKVPNDAIVHVSYNTTVLSKHTSAQVNLRASLGFIAGRRRGSHGRVSERSQWPQ